MSIPDPLEITLGEITFKASHNSYERHETISGQLEFDIDKPYQSGCMALELDIIRQSNDYKKGEISSGYFKVSHTKGASAASHLDEWLGKILGFHDSEPNHLPIIIYIDIKSSKGSFGDFGDRIDQYLRKYFREELIYTPKMLYNSKTKNTNDTYTDLCSFVVQKGWPTLESLKGKFLFCLTGNPTWKKAYADSNELLSTRLCFSDDGAENLIAPSSGNIVFFNFDAGNEFFKESSSSQKYTRNNLITRVYVVNKPDQWQLAVNKTFSAIATDKIRNNKWAFVNSQGFQYRKKINPTIVRQPVIKFLFIKNNANNEYRTVNATKMQKTKTNQDCRFIFTEQEDGNDIYSIMNTNNRKYFSGDHISKMSDYVKSSYQKWKLIKVQGQSDQYYIQNLGNSKYMTKKASKLSNDNGNDEVYILEPAPSKVSGLSELSLNDNE